MLQAKLEKIRFMFSATCSLIRQIPDSIHGLGWRSAPTCSMQHCAKASVNIRHGRVLLVVICCSDAGMCAVGTPAIMPACAIAKRLVVMSGKGIRRGRSIGHVVAVGDIFERR